MATPNWQKLPKSDEHNLILRDEAGWHEIHLNWDGCVNCWHAHNVPLPVDESKKAQFVDCTHICDLREHIEMLQSALQLACDFFGDDCEWEGTTEQRPMTGYSLLVIRYYFVPHGGRLLLKGV